VARGQQSSSIPVIGFIQSGSRDEVAVTAFRTGLREQGFVEGADVRVEYHFPGDRYDRLSDMLADLVRRQVSVIVASGGPVAQAAKSGSSNIPVVFFIGVDPVDTGLVSSLSPPGGNLTGVSNLAVEIGPKRLELLHSLIPKADSFAVLFNSNRLSIEKESRELAEAGGRLGLQLQLLRAGSLSELEALFPAIAGLGVAGLVISGDPFFNTQREHIGALSLRYRVPAIYQYREFAAAGGLMSYGANYGDLNRLTGVYVGRILKGEKPAELPIQQSAKIELIINLKTAKALGITFPLSLLGRADEVIE
jgi:putative tryptophan/tyrosine transport system substrate-binding protein